MAEEEFSNEHETIKQEVANRLSKQGYNITLEGSLRNWKIDVLAEKQGKTIAIEVGFCKIKKLSNLILFADNVYHVPKKNQLAIHITLNHVIYGLDLEIEASLTTLFIAVMKLQRFTSKPQKLVIEIMPDGNYDWRFVDV